MYCFRVDEDKGVLFVHTSGCWMHDEAKRFTQDLLKHAKIARQRFGRLKIFLDAREAILPSDQIISGFDGIEQKLLQSPDDRFATVVTSNLKKLQTRQAYASPNISAFLSESSAMTWLVGYVPNRSTAQPIKMAS